MAKCANHHTGAFAQRMGIGEDTARHNREVEAISNQNAHLGDSIDRIPRRCSRMAIDPRRYTNSTRLD